MIEWPVLALYIHWPFCLSKCPYCDFNSHVREKIDEKAWQQALLKELQRTAVLTGPRQLTSIFFGGGTPSLMSPQTVAAVIDQAQMLWSFDPNIEITLEANPNSVEVAKFQQLKSAGVNRVSLGIQALNDGDLKGLGRQHSAKEAIAAIATATQVFNRVSCDLIYARPQQTLLNWKQELATMLSFGTSHVSLYQLTIEAGTAFETLYRRGDLKIPEENLASDLYEQTQEMMNTAGFPAYEVSNHARVGEESRHNLSYWRYQDYAGVGPGAHGRLTVSGQKVATKQYRAPETWLKKVEDTGTGEEETILLNPQEQTVEAVMMGLRLSEGIDLNSLPALEMINAAQQHTLVYAGFLEQNGSQLTATLAGRQRLNTVLGQLLG